MENVKQMKNILKLMGLDLEKLPNEKLDPILKMANDIADPTNMSPEQIQRIRQSLGLEIQGNSVVQVKRSPRKRKKIGRNGPCVCESGKKYKNCCLVKHLNSKN